MPQFDEYNASCFVRLQALPVLHYSARKSFILRYVRISITHEMNLSAVSDSISFFEGLLDSFKLQELYKNTNFPETRLFNVIRFRFSEGQKFFRYIPTYRNLVKNHSSVFTRPECEQVLRRHCTTDRFSTVAMFEWLST